MTLFIVSVLFALTISFFCSLAEAALLSLTPSQVAAISAKRPKLGGIWQNFKSNIERPIAVILLLNTAAHTIGASVAGGQFQELWGSRWIWGFSLAFTVLMLQFTEILPKTFGVRYNQELAGPLGHALSWLVGGLSPLLRFIHWVNWPFESRYKAAAVAPTIDEITALAGLARLSKEIGAHQERIIKGASRLSQVKVRQTMIPVAQVSFLSASQTIGEALVAAHTDSHTRFPVIEGNDRDKVVGYVNFKEIVYFVRTNPQNPNFRGIIRPVHFVSPESSAADLMRVFIEQHVHIAIVRDEQGKTLGLVTLEDLVEELVGELEDEFDRLPHMVHALSGGTWMVGGGVPLGEAARQLGLPLPNTMETISAWLGRKLGRLPRPADVYKEGGAEYVVRRVRRGKVFELAVSRAPGGAGILVPPAQQSG